MKRLNGKVAVVTGGAQGLGFEMVKMFSDEGAKVIAVDVKDFKLELDNVESFVLDVTNGEQCETFFNHCIKVYGTIDILVNNAGTILRNPAVNHSDEYWDSVLEINLSAQFILSRALGAKMIERGNGKVIFIASLLSFQGGINVPGYAAAKGGIASLTKALANEWASKGVNVNAIAPGYIDTDNTEALRNDPDRSTSILQRIPANRWGKPSDFAGPAIFLASEAANYVHGTILTVDGGWMGR